MMKSCDMLGRRFGQARYMKGQVIGMVCKAMVPKATDVFSDEGEGRGDGCGGGGGDRAWAETQA